MKHVYMVSEKCCGCRVFRKLKTAVAFMFKGEEPAIKVKSIGAQIRRKKAYIYKGIKLTREDL